MTEENKTGDDEDTITVLFPVAPSMEKTSTDGEAESGAGEETAADDEGHLDPPDEKLVRSRADVQAAMGTLSRTLAVLNAAFEELNRVVFDDEKAVIHAWPKGEGSGLTPCCNRSPLDIPLTQPISMDGETVTCKGVGG